MIELLAALLAVYLSGGNLCEQGTPIDWYTYRTKGEAVLILRTDELDLELWQPDNVLFVYRDGLGADGQPHGQCAVSLP